MARMTGPEPAGGCASGGGACIPQTEIGCMPGTPAGACWAATDAGRHASTTAASGAAERKQLSIQVFSNSTEF
jgi:pyruvoyl-dependent arginine decarboxylase (PvlArgDC)